MRLARRDNREAKNDRSPAPKPAARFTVVKALQHEGAGDRKLVRKDKIRIMKKCRGIREGRQQPNYGKSAGLKAVNIQPSKQPVDAKRRCRLRHSDDSGIRPSDCAKGKHE